MAPPTSPEPTLAPQVQAYLDHVRHEKRLAERTCTLYRLHLIQLQTLCHGAGLALDQVLPAHVRRWSAQWHAQGRQGRGIALVLSCWRGFYAWLGQQGQVPFNPVQGVRPPRSPKPLPAALSVDQAVQLAEHSDAALPPWQQARDAAMVELLYGCGLRVSELCGLDVQASDAALREGRGWIDLSAADVQVLGKGRKRRQVPLGRAALTALQAWLTERQGLTLRDPQALFVGHRGQRLAPAGVWQSLRRHAAQAGLAVPVHPHMLRHSFASHVLQSSGDLRAVQELLGHASIATTQVYTRLDFQHLAKTYDQAHPRARRGAKG
ncbi:MAG: tyrosine recombinase XerC [Limnohabitans sp.]